MSQSSPPLDPSLINFIIISYQGDKHNNLFHGHGEAEFIDGTKYDGKWEEGNMMGGKFVFPDKMMYTGEVVNNNITGAGKLVFPNGNVYEGQVLNGYRHGNGIYTNIKTATIYDGQWLNGRRSGYGVYYYNKLKTSFYKGNWLNGKINGHGEIVYTSGNTYTGNWLNDNKSGNGKMHWKDTKQIYDGEWLNDVPHGKGEYNYLNIGGIEKLTKAYDNNEILNNNTSLNCLQITNSYNGEFINGNREGLGCFLYSSGAFYSGMWSKNLKHGQGYFVYENGKEFYGEFENDHIKNTEGFISNETSGVVHLHLNELLEKYKVQTLDLNNLFLRFNFFLRILYINYSSIATTNAADSLCLKLRGLWLMLRDCGIINASFSLGDLDEVIQSSESNEFISYIQNCNSIHDSNYRIFFRQFFEIIVRLAVHLYPSLPFLNRVEKLITEQLYVYCRHNITPSIPINLNMNKVAGDKSETTVRTGKDTRRSSISITSPIASLSSTVTVAVPTNTTGPISNVFSSSDNIFMLPKMTDPISNIKKRWLEEFEIQFYKYDVQESLKRDHKDILEFIFSSILEKDSFSPDALVTYSASLHFLESIELLNSKLEVDVVFRCFSSNIFEANIESNSYFATRMSYTEFTQGLARIACFNTFSSTPDYESYDSVISSDSSLFYSNMNQSLNSLISEINKQLSN